MIQRNAIGYKPLLGGYNSREDLRLSSTHDNKLETKSIVVLITKSVSKPRTLRQLTSFPKVK